MWYTLNNFITLQTVGNRCPFCAHTSLYLVVGQHCEHEVDFVLILGKIGGLLNSKSKNFDYKKLVYGNHLLQLGHGASC